MRKFFVEPEIQRLKLNLRENIASSGCIEPQFHLVFSGRKFSNGLDTNDFWIIYDDTLQTGGISAVIDFLSTGAFLQCVIIDKIYTQ